MAGSDDRAMALTQGGLVNPEFVGPHPALDHGLTQTPGSGNQDHIAEPALGIQGKDHARRAEVAADHLLDSHRERNVTVGKPAFSAINDRAVGEEGGHASSDRPVQRLATLHVQVGLLLSREGSCWQILCCGAGAHGHVGGFFPIRGGELVVGGLNRGGYRCRQGCARDPRPDRASRGCECRNILRIEMFQLGIDD